MDPERAMAEEAWALYGGTPAEFTAARNARAAEAKKGGERELAASIRGLAKPSVAAWAVNALVRHRGEDVDELLTVGDRMREATDSGDRDAVRELSRDRQRLLSAAVASARALGGELGVAVSDAAAVEVQQTLQAAVVDPVAAEAVRSGLLVRTFESTGVDAVDLTDAVALPSATLAGGARGGAADADGTGSTARADRRGSGATHGTGGAGDGTRAGGGRSGADGAHGTARGDRSGAGRADGTGGTGTGTGTGTKRRSAAERAAEDERRDAERRAARERDAEERAARALAAAKRDAEDTRQDAADADAELATLDLRIRENRARHEQLAEEQQELRERLEEVQGELTDTNVTAARLRKERAAAERASDAAQRLAARARTRLTRLTDPD